MFKQLGVLCAITVMLAGCGGIVSGVNNRGVQGSSLAAFSGQYAFSLVGFDATGSPLSMVGSIKADGLGNITAGEVDVNDHGTVTSVGPLSGTYGFDSNVPPAGTYTFYGNGQGALGIIELTYTIGGVSEPLAFAFSLQGGGGFGEIMSLDRSNYIASGKMELQSSSAFTLASLAGDYAMALTGSSGSNTATAAVGRLTLESNGASSNVSFDRAVAGVGSAGPTTGSSVGVVFGSGGPDPDGRGTFILTLHDALAITSQTFAYYAVSGNRIIGLEIDGNGTTTAELTRQGTPFAAATIVTPGSVFAMAGVDTAAAENEIAAAGQLQISGVGTNTATVRWDSNDAGIIVGPASFANQAVPGFDTASGRGTVSIAAGASNGLADSAVFYLTGPGAGYILDTTAGINNRALAGTLTAQAGAPFTVASDLGGMGIVRASSLSANSANSLVGLFGLTTSSGTYALAFDQRYPVNGQTQTQLDQNAANVVVLGVDEAIGRGTLTIPGGSKTATEAFYLVGPNQFVFIDVSPVSSGLNGPTDIYDVNMK